MKKENKLFAGTEGVKTTSLASLSSAAPFISLSLVFLR